MSRPTCSRDNCFRRAVVAIRDGRTFCKQHGDHLPPYERRPLPQPPTNGAP